MLDDWSHLGRELKRRTCEPWSMVPFVCYFLMTVGLGCLGVLAELIRYYGSPDISNYDGVLIALVAFFLALIGSSSFRLILVSTDKQDKVFVSFSWVISFIAIVAGIIISFFRVTHPNPALWSSVFFAFGAVWLWWIANGDDPIYKSIPIDAASGGSTERKIKGDTSKFQK